MAATPSLDNGFPSSKIVTNRPESAGVPIPDWSNIEMRNEPEEVLALRLELLYSIDSVAG